ncbi:hypothetical protein B4P00_13875 [Shewanella xiamenensis]|nr:hypothetical protein CEQ32_08470 [Shewanella sp. FDAARGOS_354]KEK28767.1 hypothetical protein SXM_1358 [Shewanella xiamenensis]KPN78027.1 hypothetical protein AEA42_05285 [Shewanella sp. Sh95]PZP27254.1 MAG: hypothetical protein DI594_21130 [Shewanella oneidensis]MBW0297312.1 hypothetical protein [Shewanella xiamenensis]
MTMNLVFFLPIILTVFGQTSQELVSNITIFYWVKLVKILGYNDDGEPMVKKVYFSLTTT